MTTILIVDDEFASLEVLALLIEGEGFRALKAAHGAEAWSLLETEAVDLVVTDLDMPVLSGAELLQRMRNDERTRATPVIVMSAQPRQDRASWGAPVVATIAKPFVFDRLLALMLTALRR